MSDKNAVVVVAGKQYIAKPGKLLVVDKIEGKVDDKIKLDKILLIWDDKKTEIGKPIVKNTVIEATIKKQFLEPKIIIAKFKAKSRYRRKNGHRQAKTSLFIDKIA